MEKIQELEHASEREMDAIMKWQTEASVDSVYYALVGDDDDTKET